jgi:streptogramin lyase
MGTLALPRRVLAQEADSATPGTLHDARWHTFSTENGLAGNSVQALWEDPQGHIWMGTENGVSQYDGQTWTTYRTSDGLIDNNVWSISGDGETVWCATTSGLSALHDGQWRHYTTRSGLPFNDIRAVLVDQAGTVWAGTFGRGIVRKEAGSSTWEHLELPLRFDGRGMAVQSIWQAPGGQIWFSTNGFGAIRLDQQGFEQFSFRAGNRNIIWGVGSEQQSDTVWFATFNGIVQVFEDDSIQVIDSMVAGVPLSQTEALAVAGGQADDLWFSTRSRGVLHYTDGTWARYTVEDGLSRNYVQAMLVDRQGRVWFGTRGGGVTMLDRQPLEPEQLRPHVMGHDIRNDAALAEWGDGAVLRSHQNNLQFQFALDKPWLPPQDVQFHYWLERHDRTTDSPVQVVQHAPAADTPARSEAFVDLSPGAYALHVQAAVGPVVGPERVYQFAIRSAPPVLAADTLDVRSEGQLVEQGLTLPPELFASSRQVELHLAARDDVTQPDQLRYRYRVPTLTTTWQLATDARIGLMLPQGTHTIEVQAIDSDNNQSETVLLTAIVPPPFWRTVLFYLLLVLLPGIVGGAVGATGYRRWSRQQALRRAVSGYVIPYDVGPLITVPDRYIGRQHVLDTILGKLDANSFYIYGEKRIGKTSLLLQLKQRLLQRNRMQTGCYAVPVFRNIQDLPQEQFWLYLVRSIAAEMPALPGQLAALDTQTAGYDDLDAEGDLERIVEHVQQHITEAGAALRIVLLLDEVDTLQRYDPAIRQRFRAFCQHMQHSVRVVLAGVLPPHGDAEDTSPWYNIFEPVTLGPLAQNDILFLIRNYNHNPYSYTREAEQAILEAGDGKPFMTQWLCSEAVKAMLAARRSSVVLADAEAAIHAIMHERSSEYAALWQQLHAETQQEVLQAARNDGTLAAEGIPDADITRLLNAGRLRPAGVPGEDGERYRLVTLFQSWLKEQA